MSVALPTSERHAVRDRPRLYLTELLIVGGALLVLGMFVLPEFSAAGTADREARLRETLRHLRQQIETYQAQHGGVAPGFPDGDPGQAPTVECVIAQLSQPTSATGQTASQRSPTHPYGPYFDVLPINPLTGTRSLRLVRFGGSCVVRPGEDVAWLYDPLTGRIAAGVAGHDASGRPYIDY